MLAIGDALLLLAFAQARLAPFGLVVAARALLLRRALLRLLTRGCLRALRVLARPGVATCVALVVGTTFCLLALHGLLPLGLFVLGILACLCLLADIALLVVRTALCLLALHGLLPLCLFALGILACLCLLAGIALLVVGTAFRLLSLCSLLPLSLRVLCLLLPGALSLLLVLGLLRAWRVLARLILPGIRLLSALLGLRTGLVVTLLLVVAPARVVLGAGDTHAQ